MLAWAPWNAANAMDYKTNCSVHMKMGEEFLERTQCVKEGQSVLDVGCGTGQLSTYVAELVGPEDMSHRHRSRREESPTHDKGVRGREKPVAFSLGSSYQFPNIDEPERVIIE